MQTVIKKILSDRKRFLSLLLSADEQETRIDKYIGRGDMFVMYTQDGVAICSAIVTDEGDGICEIKSLAVAPEFQQKGYGWRFRSKGPQKTDDYFGVKSPKKDSIINKKGRELGSRASNFRSIATQFS